jgi:hypothetical protein
MEEKERCAGWSGILAMAEIVALEAPERLKPLYQFSVGQARGHLEVISRFGRFPTGTRFSDEPLLRRNGISRERRFCSPARTAWLGVSSGFPGRKSRRRVSERRLLTS